MAVPSDFLSEWIRRGALLSLIVDAAQTLEWPESELNLAASSGYAFRRLVLLTVVTYCYAAGVQDSKEIALKISQDEILRFLCAGTFPTWQDVRDFTTGSGNEIISNTATNLGRNTVATNYWTDLSLTNQIVDPMLTSISRTNSGAPLDPRPQAGQPGLQRLCRCPQ